MKQLNFAEEYCYENDDDGRQGWLRNLRLGVIDYDNLLYLSAYGS